MQRRFLASFVVLLGLAARVDTAEAVVVGITGASTAPASSIVTANGDTPVVLATIDAASLSGVDVLWALNSSNSNQLASLVGNADLAAFVNGGGVFVYHDREVDDAETVLPGGGGINIIRETLGDTANIQVLTPGTLVTNGPNGIIDDTDLDGGFLSSHGFAVAGSLPGGATGILSRTDPNEIVDFIYSFGAGRVYYSTIPLDAYIGGGGAFALNMQRYAGNVAAFAASQVNAQPVPEPNMLTLLVVGFGLLSLMLVRRRVFRMQSLRPCNQTA